MDLTRFALDKRRIASAFLALLLLTGYSSYLSLPRAEDPGFIVRTALIQTIFPGGTPERVESLVTDKIEKAIQELPQLATVRSTSKEGVSIIFVDVKDSYSNMRPIWDQLRRKVDKVRDELPEGVVGPMVNDEFGDVYGSLIAIRGEGFSDRELEKVADELREQLLQVPDAAKVEIVGQQEERIFAEFNNARLTRYGISALQLQQILEARNIVLPGGFIQTEYEKIVLEPSGNFDSLAELRHTLIALPGHSDMVYLDDLVTIRRGYVDPPKAMIRFDGDPAIVLGIAMRDGGNILDLGVQVRQVIERAEHNYPVGIEFDLVQFQADAVSAKIEGFVGNLIQAVLIVALVMLVFLGIRTGLIVASLIPATILVSFFFMDIFGIGLDQMSLASLIIALGMLVDNAIVMSESIMVHMAGGKTARDSALAAGRELRVPLLISSLTTSAAFLPIFLAESTTGEYTAPLFKVVTITLLCSWVMALTLIPLLCVVFLKVNRANTTNESSGDSRMQLAYRQFLEMVLGHPWLALIAVIFLLALAVMGLDRVPKIFFPPNDRATFTIDLELPQGSPLHLTDQVVAQVEQFMAAELMAAPGSPGIVSWASFIGSGAPKFVLTYNPEPASNNYSFILVNSSDRQVIDSDLVPRLNEFINREIAGVNATVRALPLGAPAWPPVSVRISGRDNDQLFAIVDRVKQRLRSIPGTRNIADDWGARTKKISILVDETRANQARVSHQDIAVSLQAHLAGLQTTEFREKDRLIPIILRAEAADRLDLERLPTLSVYSQASGKSVPLAQVVDAKMEWQPGRIERRNRLRTVSVEALLATGSSSANINAELAPWLQEEAKNWPPGFSWELGGEAETSGQANASIGAKLPVAMTLILLLLILQFDSFRKTAIILLTIPLSLIGVVVGLLLAKSYFGFMTLLGIISLAGIVINNAIVLIDRIRIEIEETGLEPWQAIIVAGQQRLRPILLTTATTVGGLIPLWLGGGPMWEPMAISIIFGLVFATILTLGFVPLLYSLFFRVSPATSPRPSAVQ